MPAYADFPGKEAVKFKWVSGLDYFYQHGIALFCFCFFCTFCSLLTHSKVWSENSLDIIQYLVDAKVFHIFLMNISSVK